MVILAVLILLAAFLLYLIYPGKTDLTERESLSGHNYAHRGLHTENNSVPENCLTGFSSAVRAGYGIEFDVHITSDDKLVVFHDNNVKRVCGIEGIVEKMTFAELRSLRLNETDEVIPSFEEVLDLISGRVPLIIELKTTKVGREADLCRLVADILDKYQGPFCIESFDPRIVAWFKKNRPTVVRGQLLSQPFMYKGELNSIVAFALYCGLTSFYTRPNFISHCKGEKSLTIKLCESLGAMKFVWTIHPDDDIIKLQGENDGLIFEYFRPETRF